jgi:hypothetical protein
LRQIDLDRDSKAGSSDVQKKTPEEEFGIVCVGADPVMHLVDRRTGGRAWFTPQLSDSNPEAHPDFDSHTDSAFNPFAHSHSLAKAECDAIANSNFDALTWLFFDLAAEFDGSWPSR